MTGVSIRLQSSMTQTQMPVICYFWARGIHLVPYENPKENRWMNLSCAALPDLRRSPWSEPKASAVESRDEKKVFWK